DHYDVIFVDQLSANIPLLRLTGAKVLFYCHFPDKLLTQRETTLKNIYRVPIDFIEEVTTGLANCVVVNSEFTANVFCKSFTTIRNPPQVLYPGIHLEAYDKDVDHKDESVKILETSKKVILSINRFEKKKNIVLAIRAFTWLRDDKLVDPTEFENMRLIIAVHSELNRVAMRAGLKTHTILPDSTKAPSESAQVIFVCSFNEAQRTYLLSKAFCLLYTPENEHFGITPIEAMYSKLPVIACNSGGPRETIRNGVTGILCEPKPMAFAEAISSLVNGHHDRYDMGENGRFHVLKTFSSDIFIDSLENLLIKLVAEPSKAIHNPLIWLSTMELYKQANDAFFEDDYDEALELYNKAISLDATNVEYLLKRSATFQKIKKNMDSLADAEKALSLVEGKEGQEAIAAKALLRKGIAQFELKEYQAAKTSFDQSKELNPNEKSLATWLKKTEVQLEKMAPKPTSASGTMSNNTSGSAFLSQSRVRHEWFQNESFIIISIFIKNVKKETVDVYMADRSVSVTIKLPTGSDYSLELDPLAHEIDPKESKYEVLSTKVEIKLKKANVGIRWGVLEGEDSLVGSIGSTNDSSVLSYPSSAKHAKNWDKLEKEISGEQEKPEGDAALNSLFQQLYRDADDDTKKAMMKSYTESNGTCLSTNWGEVSKGKVETKPPEVELKNGLSDLISMSFYVLKFPWDF
ncbi:4722_t:CDS:10, partial [Acaulospora morrowiae]